MLIVDTKDLSVAMHVLSCELDNISCYLNCLLLFKLEHESYSYTRWIVLHNNKLQTIYFNQLAKVKIL